MSYAKWLSKQFGGKWTYACPCYWHCDDNIRYVVRVSGGVDEWDELIGHPTMWLYGAGAPQRVVPYAITL